MTALALLILIVCYCVLGCMAVLLGMLFSFDEELSWEWRIGLFLGWPVIAVIVIAIKLWPLVLMGLIGGCVWAVLFLAGVF